MLLLLGLELGLALLLLPRPVQGQPTAAGVAISLRDAVARAVQHNPALAQTGAELAQADDAVLTARGLDDLVLDAGLSWLQVRHQLIAGAPVQQPAFDDVLATLWLTQPLPTGGRLGLRLGSDYSRTEYATDLGASVQRSVAEAVAPSLQVTLQHPLLRGLGPKVARAPRRRALVQRDAAALARQQAAAMLLREVVQAYWDLYYASRELAIRRAAAAAAREQLERVQAQIDVGKQPPSAAAEVQVAAALRDETALLAAQARSERSIELERLLGQPTASGPELIAAEEPSLAGEPLELDAAVVAALGGSAQLALARAAGRAAQIEVEVTANGLLPQLDLMFSGGTVGNASDAGIAFGQLGQLGSYSVNAALALQLPLQNRLARGSHAAALHSLRRAQLSEQDVRNQLVAAVKRLAAAVHSAGQRARLLERSVAVATLDLAAERARFETGRSTSFDVLRRQDEVAQVQLGQARAQVDEVRARAALEALSGRILERFGVHLR